MPCSYRQAQQKGEGGCCSTCGCSTSWTSVMSPATAASVLYLTCLAVLRRSHPILFELVLCLVNVVAFVLKMLQKKQLALA